MTSLARVALAAAIVAALTGSAAAQAVTTPSNVPTPNNPANFGGNAHPVMPFDPATRGNKQFVRQWAVPERQVTVPVPVTTAAPAEEPETEGPLLSGPPPAAEGAAAAERRGVEMRTVRVPGYTITETLYGYHYPPRWMFVETSPGEFRWQFLPEAFVPRR